MRRSNQCARSQSRVCCEDGAGKASRKVMTGPGAVGRIPMIAAAAVALLVMCGPANATLIIGPLTFSSDSDYQNSNPPTGGLFRDLLNPSYVNRGNDIFTGDAGVFTALCFNNGTQNQSGGITVYDTNPTNSTPTLFGGNGTFTIETDVISYEQTNGTQTGLLLLYDSANDIGIGLFESFAGGTKGYYIATWKSNNSKPAVLAGAANNMNSVGGFAELAWLHMTLDMTLSGSSISLTGKVFSHATNSPNNPSMTQLGTTLTYSGTLGTSAGITTVKNTGEIGMSFASGGNTSAADFTNFSFAPEPGTLVLVGVGAVALLLRRRRR